MQGVGRAPRMFLVGYYGFGNAGDELILRAALADLRAAAPGLEVTVLSHDPASTETDHGVTAVPRHRPDRVLAAVREADLVLVGGGGLLQDATGAGTVPYYAGLAWTGRVLGRGSAGYALGVGPLRRRASRWWIRMGFAGAPLSVRDEGSAEWLVSCGIAREQITVTADPVWGLEMGDQEVAPTHDNVRSGIPVPRRIGIALRPWPGWEDAAERIAEGCRRAFDAELVAIPFHPALDRSIAERVARAHPRGQVADWASLDDLVRAVAGCDLIVTMRYHAGVLAARLGIPFMALSPDGAEGKVGQVARVVGEPVRGLDEVQEAISSAWGTREAQRVAGQRASANLGSRARGAAATALHAIMTG